MQPNQAMKPGKLPPTPLGAKIFGFFMFLVAVFAVYALWVYQPSLTLSETTCESTVAGNPLDEAITTFRTWFGLAGQVDTASTAKLCPVLKK